MITIETRPVRYSAVQWHKPGDVPELVVFYPPNSKLGRWGVHSAAHGFQRVEPGDWIVIGEHGRQSPRVCGNDELHKAFRIVEEPGHDA